MSWDLGPFYLGPGSLFFAVSNPYLYRQLTRTASLGDVNRAEWACRSILYQYSSEGRKAQGARCVQILTQLYERGTQDPSYYISHRAVLSMK